MLIAGTTRYINNFVNGPFELAAVDLNGIHDIATTPRYFARVVGSRTIDTQIREYKVHTSGGLETSRSVYGAYYALVVGDRFLLAKADGDPPTVVEGELLPLSTSLEEHLFDTREMQGLRNRFYPFYISSESFRLPGYVAIAVALAFGFFFVRLAIPAWKQFQDPARHPLIKRVASWGDPLKVDVEVERDFRSPRHKGGNGWALGDTYLVQSRLFTFDVLRFSDLLWAFKRITKHSVNFIPTGKTYEAVLVCYGGKATVTGRQKRVDEILAFATERAPWAVLGYTEEVATLFNKSTPEFCAAVEKRRREWEKRSEAARNRQA